jgi:uncharacterized protein (TIGR03032 family)
LTAPTTPYSCQHSPQLPELLHELGCSLALTTYQAGKLILLSSDGERLIQLPRSFEVPMGLAVAGPRMALATKHEIVLLANEPRLAPSYPNQPGTYDALFVPRATHYSGALLVHDLVFTERGLIGVNTLFSCLFQLDPLTSFRPLWKPRFVSALAPQDRCHLNGLAIEDGQPRYVTALGATDTPEGWRPEKERGGVLIDVASGEMILAELPMPHSPRVCDGRLFALLSATGELIEVDRARGRFEVVNRVSGFARGLARCGDYLFVATSRMRPKHTFGDLRFATDKSAFCGLTVLHLASGAQVAELRYLRSCEEIYDVQVLPGLRRPGVLGISDAMHRRALSTPEQTFWGAPNEDEASGAFDGESTALVSSRFDSTALAGANHFGRRVFAGLALAGIAATASCTRERAPRATALDPAAAELVALLAADASPIHPVDFTRARDTGSDLAQEALRSDVDLVIGPPGTAAARSLAASAEPLRKFPPAVDFEPHNFDEAFAAAREIATALGRSAAAESWERAVRAELAAISASSLGQGRPRVAVLLQLEPPLLAGGHSFLTELVEIAGAENLTHGSEEREISMSLPAIVAASPDLLLLVSAAGARGRDSPTPSEPAPFSPLPQLGTLRLEAWSIDVEGFWISGAAPAARALRARVAALAESSRVSAPR